MIAFLLTIGLFALWSVVGFALMSVVTRGAVSIRNALLSPVIGIGCIAVAVTWTNGLGVPVQRAGPVICFLFVGLSAGVLFRQRPALAWRNVRKVLFCLLFAALITGYPMLRFGFDWLSYCNEDMANYVVASKRFLEHGFFTLPDPQHVLNDNDASAFYYFFNVLSGIRPGPEETIAFVASITGTNALLVFMPTILALHLVLISATGALVMRRRRSGLAALATCGWLAVSALTALGTLYQLIAQVFGLALLIAVCTIAMRPMARVPVRVVFRNCVPFGILVAAMGIIYPEVMPFAVVAIGCYHGYLLIRRSEAIAALVMPVAITGLLSILILGLFTPSALMTLVSQASRSREGPPSASIAFPYYLLPSGLAQIWGFLPIARWNSPLYTVAVPVGATLLMCVSAGAAWIAWHGEAAGFACLVMIAVGVQLFAHRVDFGLFKLAMFVQPFLISSAVLSWLRLVGRRQKSRRQSAYPRWFVYGPLAAVAVLGMNAQLFYVRRSADGPGDGFVEIRGASEGRLVAQLEQLSRQPRRPNVISDTDNITMGKLEALYVNPSSVYFPAWDYFHNHVASRPSPEFAHFLDIVVPGYEHAVAAAEERLAGFQRAVFDLHDDRSGGNSFEVRPRINEIMHQEFTLLESWKAAGILNRWGSADRLGMMPQVRFVPSEKVRDHLILVRSVLGEISAVPEARGEGRVALYPTEKDYFRPGRLMSAIGRDCLFNVVRPDPQIRLVLEFTASLNADKVNAVPPASIIGAGRVHMPARGRGSSRLFSPPVAPQVIAGGNYIGLDMGAPGIQFPDRRTGIMQLFGTDIPLDPRRISGFVRGISAIGEADYARMHPPQKLEHFPEDLENSDLEYSGIYEDGWVAEDSYMVLSKSDTADAITIRLSVPTLQGKASASVLVVQADGQEIGREALTGGDVEFCMPVRSPAPAAGRHRIELRFDRAANLPAPDFRPVSARIRSIGFNQMSSPPQALLEQ